MKTKALSLHREQQRVKKSFMYSYLNEMSRQWSQQQRPDEAPLATLRSNEVTPIEPNKKAS